MSLKPCCCTWTFFDAHTCISVFLAKAEHVHRICPLPCLRALATVVQN